jgi:glycine/D-amino acid oxidase-like deaminating enzyme
LWPYKFVSSLLARLLERTSINVQTNTPVTSISSCQDGSSLVNTARGSIRANKIVFATNAYTGGIAQSYSDTIVPVKATCSHIKTPKDTKHPPPHLTQTYGLSFGTGPGIRDYLIPRPDGGVICGGAKDTYVENKKLWWNNFDDSTLIEPARKHFETVMQDNFRSWEKSGAFVDYLW